MASPSFAEEKSREPIGEVFGNPVYRGQIRLGKGHQLRSELHRLFTGPVMVEYRKKYRAEIQPTEQEIEAVSAYFVGKHQEQIKDREAELKDQLERLDDRLSQANLPENEKKKLQIDRQVIIIQLEPPGRDFARWFLSNWKFQRHLYDHYGGGRILWQQAGLEAFDAMHQWLKQHEKNGDFKITDPKLRTVFYEYWTTMKHGAFLFDDKETIDSEFLNPEWLWSIKGIPLKEEAS